MATKEMVVHEVEVADTAALVAQPEAGVMALAYMDEHEFGRRLAALKTGQERVRRIQRELMVGPTGESGEGEDYGVIPGTKKPTLLKPGAEKLCNVYGLVGTYEIETILGDGVVTPPLRVAARCLLHRGSEAGPIVGEGRGAANSWERKHRYRGAQKACPSCGAEGTIRRSSFERDGDRGWYCHAKSGGCGEQFQSRDERITHQQAGQVENPDPWDVENTLVKMAKKRAYVDATLTATATSGLFSQDLEDQPAHAEAEAQPAQERSQPAAPASSAPAPKPRQSAPAPAPSGSRTQRPQVCPRCGTKGSVIASKHNPGTFVCWKKASPTPGCGYEFGPADIESAESGREPGSDDE